jgi:hypothetical protein
MSSRYVITFSSHHWLHWILRSFKLLQYFHRISFGGRVEGLTPWVHFHSTTELYGSQDVFYGRLSEWSMQRCLPVCSLASWQTFLAYDCWVQLVLNHFFLGLKITQPLDCYFHHKSKQRMDQPKVSPFRVMEGKQLLTGSLFCLQPVNSTKPFSQPRGHSSHRDRCSYLWENLSAPFWAL